LDDGPTSSGPRFWVARLLRQGERAPETGSSVVASSSSVTDRLTLSTSITGRRRVAVAAGGAVGAVGRALVIELADAARFNAIWATFFVNVAGSLLLGYLVARHAGRSRSSVFLVPFAGVGVLGAFTTFSLFSTEVFELMRSGDWLMAVIYSIGSVLAGFTAALAGVRFGGSR